MPPTSIEENQADYSRRYRPIDAARYQTEQAQSYYERMRAQINERSKSLISRQDGVRTRGFGDSFYQAARAGRHEPREREYRTEGRRNRAYTRDMVERTMQAPMNFYDAFNEFGAEFGVAEHVEDYTTRQVFGGAMGMGTMKAMGHGMLAGGAAGLAAYGAAEGAIQYTGIREGFNQFSEINKLRGASRPMTAGTAAGPNGRMSRDMAQNIVTDLSQDSRIASIEREGESLSELKEQAGILADYQLLEGVRSADQFEKKFKELKEGVKKVMEVMGTTFEEGTKLMKDFRNVGVSPMTGARLINQGRLTSAQFGNNFREGHASGMQTAMAMRGTGFTVGAGYQMGQYASGMAQTIYEGNYLDDATMYNLGGQRGLQTELQRGGMRFMESAPFTAMMMGAQTQGGRFDTQAILQTLSGQRNTAQNAAAAGESITSVEDVLSFRANNREFISNMIESNPGILQGLQVQSIMGLAERTGQNPQDMTEDELAEFAGMTGMMTPDQFKAASAATRALPETIGRRRRERRRTAESRARDMYRTGFIEQVSEGLRELPATRNFAMSSAAAMTGTRENIYHFQQEATDAFMREFQGQRMINASSNAATFFSELENVSAERGGIYRDPNDLFSTSDTADIMEQRMKNNESESMVKVPDNRMYGESVALTDEEIDRLGIDEDAGEEVDNLGTVFTYQELADQGLVGAEGDPQVESGDEIIKNIWQSSGPFGSFTNPEAAGNAIQGMASMFSGTNQLIIDRKEVAERRQETEQQLARGIARARESTTGKDIKMDLSDEGRSLFTEYFEGLGISREEVVDVRNRAGEEGTHVASNFVQETLKEALNLDGDVGSDQLKENIASQLEDPAMAEAVGMHLQRLGGMGLEKQIRQLETFFQTGGRSPSDIQNTLESGMSVLDRTTDDLYSDQSHLGGLIDSQLENDVDQADVRDALLQRMYVENHGGPENLPDDLRRRYQESQKRLRGITGLGSEGIETLQERYRTQIEEQEDLSVERLYESLHAVGTQGILGGSGGEETAAVSGGQQRIADPDGDQRQEIRSKLLDVAKQLRKIQKTTSRMQSVQEDIVESTSVGGYGGAGNPLEE